MESNLFICEDCGKATPTDFGCVGHHDTVVCPDCWPWSQRAKLCSNVDDFLQWWYDWKLSHPS